MKITFQSSVMTLFVAAAASLGNPTAFGQAGAAPAGGEPIATPAKNLTGGKAAKPIGTIAVEIAVPAGAVPDLQPLAAAVDRNDGATPSLTLFSYAAAGTHHRGLLYQDVNLERYGHHYGALQPVVSGARFIRQTIALPYTTLVQRSRRPVYTLGYGRPGSCVHPRLYFSR